MASEQKTVQTAGIRYSYQTDNFKTTRRCAHTYLTDEAFVFVEQWCDPNTGKYIKARPVVHVSAQRGNGYLSLIQLQSLSTALAAAVQIVKLWNKHYAGKGLAMWKDEVKL